jgi:uncharacterized membrane protein YfhO
VDERKVIPEKVLGSFIGIPLSKGEHQVVLDFVPKGFKVGRVISIISLLLFIVVVWYERVGKKGQKGRDLNV